MTNVAMKTAETERGHEYEFKPMPVRMLVTDDLYQRGVDQKRVNRIVKKWNPDKENPPKVSMRNDGTLFIMDGQHTAVAHKTVYGNDSLIYCKVYRGLTWAEEVELFISQHDESRALTINEKLRAMYNNNDKDVRGMVLASELAGVRVDFGKAQKINKVTAVSTLFQVYKRMPRDQYIDMLIVLRDAWNGNPEGFSRELLTGAAEFFKTYYNQFKLKDLTKSLSRVAPIQIVREGKIGGTTSSTYARVILKYYNSGRSTNRLPNLL